MSDIKQRLYPNTIPQPAIPKGWQLVPVEPTAHMLDYCERKWNELTAHTFGDFYKAMLAAAPKPEVKP